MWDRSYLERVQIAVAEGGLLPENWSSGPPETFVIDHANAKSCREQKHGLLAVDSLRLTVATLQDSILRLEAARAAAYETGYQAAYGAYQHLSRRYVAELRRPSISMGSALGIVGALGLGVLVGRAIP